ncbi:MAG: HEAT repeat domain-containing protein [Planctomycetes bacterium]|nr:HEAT repeat domain-containing protein [Planctomycetota bacterium]
MSKLPAHVPAPNGQLSLFADYGEVHGDYCVLYLINRTSQRLAFAAQDCNPYVKLDVLTATGHWERAQAHYNAGCGNSYSVFPSLRPGEFFRFLGYYPADGEPCDVRFRVYHDRAYVLADDTREEDVIFLVEKGPTGPLDVTSNVGKGRARFKDIEAARHDALAIPFGSFETVRALATGEAADGTRKRRSDFAVQALGRFPTEESLELLRGLLTDSDPTIAMAAMWGLAKMGLKLDSAEKLYQELLRGDDLRLRLNAMRALTERPVTPEVISFAKDQLAHDDLMVRGWAMSAIASRCKDDPEMKAYINSIYDDPDPKIQSVFQTLFYPTCINYQERGRKIKLDDPSRAQE